MSDSPLDGGSGWPTSAYAIVPRQATPQTPAQAPAQTPAQTPAQSMARPTVPAQPKAAGAQAGPEIAARAEAGPPQAEGPSRRWRIIVLIIGLIVLVVAAVGGVLATRKSGGPAGEARAVTTPGLETTAAATTAPAGAATAIASGSPGLGASGSPVPGLSGSPDPSAVVTSPAPPGAITDVLRAGTVRLTVLAGQPDETFDFDSGAKQAGGADVAAGALGLTAEGSAAFAPVPQAPTLAICSAVPAAQWSDRVVLTALLPGAKVCLRTGDQRFGWFSPRSGDAVISGQLYTTYLDFTVWKKTGD